MQSSCHQLQLRPGPSPSPSPSERAPLKQLCKFSIYVSACHGGHTHQVGRQAGSRYESIRLLTFVIFLFCLPFPLLLVPSQRGRQAVRLRIRHVAPSTETDNYRLAVEIQLQLPEMCGPTHARTHTHTIHAHLWQCLSNLHIAV